MAATILVGGLTISACSDAPRQGLRSSTSSTTSAAADRLVSQSSLYDVATLGEVAALSTDIIVGQVVKVERGPVIGDAEAPLGVMRVVVRITEVLAGDPDRSSVAILVTGFDPVTGEITRPEGEHHPAVGMEGIWFLHPTELPSQPGTFYVSTSAGQLLRGADSRVVTGGEEQASGILCGAAWRAALEKVRIVAATATEGDRPVPGVAFHRLERGVRTPALMYEGLYLLLDHGFRAFDLRRVYFDIPGFNLDQFQSAVDAFLAVEGRLTGRDYVDRRYWDATIAMLDRERWEGLRERLRPLVAG